MTAAKSKKPSTGKKSEKTKADAATAKPLKAVKAAKSVENQGEEMPRSGWLQDASLEIPVPPTMSYNKPGQRQLEFSVGLRQQEAEGLVRSELRGRALIHAEGAVLALAEASYVNILPSSELAEDVAIKLYESLRPHMESLLSLAGHTPPLPATLDKVE